MGWKDWPVWLKGGVIGVIIELIIFIFVYTFNYFVYNHLFNYFSKETSILIGNLIIFPLYIMLGLQPNWISYIVCFMIYFLIGAIIGFIVGKIRNR